MGLHFGPPLFSNLTHWGKANNRACSSPAKLFIEVSVCGCSSPSLALPRGLSSCHAYCIASKHHDRLQNLSILLRSRRYTHDMLWIPPNQAPGSGSSHTSSTKLGSRIRRLKTLHHVLQAAHPALRALFPELVLARKARRPGESEELQTSGVLALAETSDCIHHRLVECATQAVQ